MQRVAVTLETPGKDDVEVITRCDTVKEAEDFIAKDPSIDPAARDAGHYGIDAPEEMINGPADQRAQATVIEVNLKNFTVKEIRTIATILLDGIQGQCLSNPERHDAGLSAATQLLNQTNKYMVVKKL